jgi:hypothetical protein
MVASQEDQQSHMSYFGHIIETRLFRPMAASERSHEPAEPRVFLPWGPIVTLVALSTFLFVVFITAIVWPWTSPASRPSTRNYYLNADIIGLSVTVFFTFMLLWSFIATVLTDPGRVPKQWPWDPKEASPYVADDPQSDSESLRTPLNAKVRGLERKLDGRTRFCKKCNMYKPDRAHHCKKLGRCVLEMDHWCPWVRNTIGYKNRKFFFLSVTYGWITLFSYCVVLGPYLSGSASLRNALDFFIIFCWVLACIQLLLLLAFWSFHLYLTIRAFTTIEFREKHLAKDSKVMRGGDKIKDLYKQSVYDLGAYSNFVHLLGPNILLWMIPTRYGMSTDPTAGATFRVREDHPLTKISIEPKKDLNGHSADKNTSLTEQDSVAPI